MNSGQEGKKKRFFFCCCLICFFAVIGLRLLAGWGGCGFDTSRKICFGNKQVKAGKRVVETDSLPVCFGTWMEILLVAL